MITQMNIMEGFVVIDINALASWLSDEEWNRDFEEMLPFSELYEKIDDSGQYYLREEYSLIRDAIEEEWKSILMEFEKEHVAAIINPN